MKVSELIGILSRLPQDSDVEFTIQREIPEDRLKKYDYPYPYDLEKAEYVGFDVGYSSSVSTIFLEGLRT